MNNGFRSDRVTTPDKPLDIILAMAINVNTTRKKSAFNTETTLIHLLLPKHSTEVILLRHTR